VIGVRMPSVGERVHERGRLETDGAHPKTSVPLARLSRSLSATLASEGPTPPSESRVLSPVRRRVHRSFSGSRFFSSSRRSRRPPYSRVFASRSPVEIRGTRKILPGPLDRGDRGV
jgi:hypothetical protein